MLFPRGERRRQSRGRTVNLSGERGGKTRGRVKIIGVIAAKKKKKKRKKRERRWRREKKVFAGEIRLGDERVKLTVNKLTVSGGRGGEKTQNCRSPWLPNVSARLKYATHPYDRFHASNSSKPIDYPLAFLPRCPFAS